MLPSIETRWFMPGLPPPEALAWIHRWELGPGKPEKRKDHYLSLPGTKDIGIKVRDDKFEVKRRDLLDLGFVSFGVRALGRPAVWRKWSFKVPDDESNKAPDSYWITVEKERHLRKYRLDDADLKANAVDPGSFPARGCTVELTQLEVRGVKWWSVGFEAFDPDESQLRNTLNTVVQHCFHSEDYPTLNGEDSFDYPEWLASFAAKQE
jgi:hypothetical protein